MEKIGSNEAPTDLKCEYEFELRLYIKHPTLSLAYIDSKICLVKSNGWSVGEGRKTPKGRLLEGSYKETYWNYSKAVLNRRDFFTVAQEFYESLESESTSQQLLREIVESDGRIYLVLGLFGNANIGDVLDIRALEYFAVRGVSIGVELF